MSWELLVFALSYALLGHLLFKKFAPDLIVWGPWGSHRRLAGTLLLLIWPLALLGRLLQKSSHERD